MLSSFDYIVIGAFGVLGIIGLLKGFLKQAFGFVGVFVIALGASPLSAYIAQWLCSLEIEFFNESNSATIAFLLAVFALSLVYGMITKAITNKIEKNSTMKTANRLLGFAFGGGTVYLVVAVLIALTNTPIGESLLLSWLNPILEGSILANTVYASNPIGEWLIQKLSEQFATETALLSVISTTALL